MECWRDLQQRLTVRNSVVYVNCNLFHSLSEPGEPRVSKGSVSVYMSVRMCASPGVCLPARVPACVLTPVRFRGLQAGPGCLFIQRVAGPGDVYSSVFMLLPGPASSGDFRTSNRDPASPLHPVRHRCRPAFLTASHESDHPWLQSKATASSSLVLSFAPQHLTLMQPPGRSSHPHEEATLGDLLALTPPLPLASSLCLRKNRGLFKSRRPGEACELKVVVSGLGPDRIWVENTELFAFFFPTLTMKRW